MRYRGLVLALLAVLVVVALIWLKSHNQSFYEHSNPAIAAPRSLGIAFYPITGQIDASRLSSNEIRAEVKRRNALDKNWEWKVPIKFVGKVVDENEQPVPEAKIKFQWTNLSAKGTGSAETKTDEQGFFSL